MTVYGEAVLRKFAKKHNQSRKPLARFLGIARHAEWKHFPDVKAAFPAADYAAQTGNVIFDIGGNKYRLITLVDFDAKILDIQSVMTHEEYNRERL